MSMRASPRRASRKKPRPQASLSTLQTRRTDLEAEIADYEERRDALQPQVTELTRTLADRSAELETLETDIATARNAGAGETYTVANGSGAGLGLTLAGDGTFSLTNAGR